MLSSLTAALILPASNRTDCHLLLCVTDCGFPPCAESVLWSADGDELYVWERGVAARLSDDREVIVSMCMLYVETKYKL